uniref:Uncharacterized protein n=1 Tax=Arundo donax TaxID=35708 RepID=A0A0A9F265_ARUDO
MEAASAMGREKSLEISSYDRETLVGLGGAGALEAMGRERFEAGSSESKG